MRERDRDLEIETERGREEERKGRCAFRKCIQEFPEKEIRA